MNPDSRNRPAGTRVAALAAAAALAACAAGPPASSEADAPYQLRGVSVARPAGDWQVAANTPTALILRKPGAGASSFVMGLTGVSAAQLDLRTPEGQRRAVEGMLVAAEVTRYRIVELTFLPQRRQGAECVAYDAVVEERAGEGPGPALLLLTNHGFLCRHPDSLTYYVAGAFSERRGRDEKPLLDPRLRGEATQFLDSVRFTSL
jgi:hypothetical protein